MWWGAFILGFIGSTHCLVMCGPLIAGLPGSQSLAGFLSGRFIYNIGRVTTYGILGIFIGSLGRNLLIATSQQTISIVIGLIMCLLAFGFIANKVEALGAIAFHRINKRMADFKKHILKKGQIPFMLFSGTLNGLLPCGLVYVALAASMTSASSLEGGLFMLYFGLGTFPAMIVMAIIGRVGQNKFFSNLSKYGALYVAFLGLLLIIRGLNLEIPYLSPAVSFFYPNLPTPAICN